MKNKLFLIVSLLSFLCIVPCVAEDGALQDPELTNLPLPKLVLAQEPPDGLRLPDPIVKKDEWRGLRSAVQEEHSAVFQHADAWKAFWEKALAPFSERLVKTPDVDFGQYMVVGVFLGERMKPNFEIEIRSVREEVRGEAGKVLVVRFREIKKMEGVFNPPFAIQPYHLKRVPLFTGPVLFENIHR